MDKILLRNLQILTEVSREHPVTQREMAKSLGIALGLANTYLKRLVRKGHIMVRTMPGNRIIYNLTPKGISEKASLTYEYMKFSFEYYKNIRVKFKEAFQEMEGKKLRNVIFYGAGEVAEIAYISLNGINLGLLYLVDDYKHGAKFFDKHIYPKEKLIQDDFDRVIITAFTSRETINQNIEELNISREKIIFV